MTILFNHQPIKLPTEVRTVDEFIKFRNIPSQGTAVAINNKLVKRDQWAVKTLNDMDNVTVISAAYGG